ncbi:chromate transporter, partial [Escherichia coli]|uniref:ChrA n=24 Tax=Enterobacterales TaxID=91347 RepID=A0A2S0NT83_ECOLX
MTNNPTDDSRPWSVFLIFLRLGLTSFGGPIAHLGYFRAEFVTRRRWLSERSYADLVALCQFLPGPASSQVGIAVGLSRAGYSGALAAWAGFTLPSAIALILFALGISSYGDYVSQGALHGLKGHCCKVSDEAAFCLIQRPYISKTLLTRRISPRGSP